MSCFQVRQGPQLPKSNGRLSLLSDNTITSFRFLTATKKFSTRSNICIPKAAGGRVIAVWRPCKAILKLGLFNRSNGPIVGAVQTSQKRIGETHEDTCD